MQPFYNFDNIQINEHYNKIGKYVTGYITPRYNILNDERPCKQILLPPDNRIYIKSIIDKHIKIDENIKNKAKMFLNKYSDKYKMRTSCFFIVVIALNTLQVSMQSVPRLA